MTNTLASRDGQGMLSDWIRRPRCDGHLYRCLDFDEVKLRSCIVPPCQSISFIILAGISGRFLY